MLLQDVSQEIKALHDFFVDWYSGACPEDEAIFERRLGQRLDPGMHIIPPNGLVIPAAGLLSAVRMGYKSNAEFRIAIGDVVIQHAAEGVVVATYHEWQRNALNTKPRNNGRVASAVLKEHPSAPGGLRWLHVQETWLPPEIMASNRYDF